MIEKYLDRIEDKLYILYTGDYNLLHDRINRRNEEIGKGATEDEWKVLDQSNLMFIKLGEFLKTVFPDKIEMIEVTKFTTPEELLEKVLTSNRDNKSRRK